MRKTIVTVLICVHTVTSVTFLLFLGGPAPPGHFHAIPDSSYRVKGRTYIQDGELIVVFVDIPVIVVDDITHLLPTAVDNPVVSVKRQLVAENEGRSTGEFNL